MAKRNAPISDKMPSPPADPVNRREPLPSQVPKPAAEDPGAAARIKAILNSPGYRRADKDLDFIGEPPLRGVRLQIDYLKPELLLEKHNIRHTIVVFGSTRICEPTAAQRKVDGLKASQAHDPANSEWAKRLAVAERVLAKSKYYDVARAFGRLVGAAGQTPKGPHCTVVTGGGPGIMEAANRGAFDIKAETIGLNISLPHEQYPNPYITPELCINFHYFAIRKLHFLLRARALVAFPGGYGTFDELFEALTLVQTRKMKPIPIVLVGEEYWRRAVNLDFLVEEGVIDPEDRELLWFAETAEDIWDSIQRWYDMSGESLDGTEPLNRV